MAKRLTSTDKWKEPHLRALPAPYKLLWFYIMDDCDHAGIWTPDFEVAQIRIGCTVTEAGALEAFGPRVNPLENGRWFFPDFIAEQYGELKENNRMHLSVIQLLGKNGLAPCKPHISPLQGAKDMDKDKRKEKEKENARGKIPEPQQIQMPFESDAFKFQWATWTTYRKQAGHPYKSRLSEEAALKKVFDLSGGNESQAIAILEQSIANGWQGIFEIKLTVHGNERKTTSRDGIGGDPTKINRTGFGSL